MRVMEMAAAMDRLAAFVPWEYALVRPHRWQRLALAVIADRGLLQNKKGVVAAATGSGKTVVQTELAAMVLPSLRAHERIIVTAPSQALVEQLAREFSKRLPGRVGCFYEHDRTVNRPVIVACHASLVESHVRCSCHPPPKEGMTWPIDARWRRFFPPCEHHPSSSSVCVDGGLALALAKERLGVKLWIADEAHKTSCKQVMAFVHLHPPSRRVGFSATPFRSSVRERLWLFEEELVRYSPTEALRDGVIVAPDIRSVTEGQEGDTLDETLLSMIREAEGPGVINAWDCADADAFAAWLCERGFSAASLHSGLPKKEQADRLRRLQKGGFRALVHVNLLVEGRDLPWLRWIALRRVNQGQGIPTIAATRLVQEVGRVLRTSPGKKAAVIYDPHGLFHVLSLTQDALLGGEWAVTNEEEEAEGEKEEEDQETKPSKPSPGRRAHASPISMSDPLSAWALRLRSAGVAPWRPRLPSRLRAVCDPDTRKALAQKREEKKDAIFLLSDEERSILDPAFAKLDRGSLTQAQADDALAILDCLQAAERKDPR